MADASGNGQAVVPAVSAVCRWSCLFTPLHTTSQVLDHSYTNWGFAD